MRFNLYATRLIVAIVAIAITLPACTTAQMAAPRACPSSRVDWGLTLTNTFSIAVCTGRCAAITSASPSRRTLMRSGNSPSPLFTQPLVT